MKYPATAENLAALIKRADETDAMCARYADTHPDKVQKWSASARRDRREIARISEVLATK